MTERWITYYETLDDLVSELRAGSIDQPTFFRRVDEAKPKLGVADASEREGRVTS